jgi:hypothetical protein
MALRKTTRVTESASLEFRFETFNTFNHAQFYARTRWTATAMMRFTAEIFFSGLYRDVPPQKLNLFQLALALWQ